VARSPAVFAALAVTASKESYYDITIIFSREYIMANKSKRRTRRRNDKNRKRVRKSRRYVRAVKSTRRHRVRRRITRRRRMQRGGAEVTGNIGYKGIGSLLDVPTSMITLDDHDIRSYLSGEEEPLGVQNILHQGKKHKVQRPIQCLKSQLK